MSIEEDTELRDLVAQTLETKGILPKIKAELRANVFLALEENTNTKESLLKNDKLSAFLQIPIGSLILNLIREFLEFFDLDFTLSVFEPETRYGKDYTNLPREKMIKQLNINEFKKKNPVLFDVISNVISSNEEKSKNSNKEVAFDMQHVNNSDLSVDSDLLNTPSPTALNRTYVKNNVEENLTPVETSKKVVNGNEEDEDNDENDNDNDESIDEDLISNKSSISETSSKMHTEKSNRKGLGLSPFITTDQESKFESTTTTAPDPNEIDLLTFTPVKEVKAKDKIKREITGGSEKKGNEDKSKQNSMSALGDLPPLNTKTEFNAGPKLGKMKEIRAIIEQGLDMDNYDEDFHSSLSSKGSKDLKDAEDDKVPTPIKSDRSQNSQISEKSEKTETVDDFDEDLSDFINSHTSSENQLTVDETISKISGVDHVESV